KAGAIAETKKDYGADTPFWAAAQAKRFQVMRRLLELKQVSASTIDFAVGNAGYEGKPELLDFLLTETKAPITLGLYRLARVSPKAADSMKVLLQHGFDVN